MRSFKNRSDKFYELRNQTILKTVPLALIAGGIGLYPSWSNPNVDLESIGYIFIIIPLTMTIGLVSGLVRAKKLYYSYILTVDDDKVIREQLNTPVITIPINEISQIIKNKNGSITIKGSKNSDLIGIASQIEDKEDLEALLQRFRSIDIGSAKGIMEKYPMLVIVSFTAIMAVVFISPNKYLVTLTGLPLVGFLIWSFFKVRESKNVDSRTKKMFYFVILPVIGILGKIFGLWTIE